MFVPFTLANKTSFSPRISIWKNGMLSVSAGAVRHFALDNFQQCCLHYCAERRLIGLRFCLRGDHPEAVNIHWRKTNVRDHVPSPKVTFLVPAKSFLKSHQIPHAVAHQYELGWSRESNLYVFDLNSPLGHDSENIEPVSFVEESVAALESFLEKSGLTPKSSEDKARMAGALYEQAAKLGLERSQIVNYLLSARFNVMADDISERFRVLITRFLDLHGVQEQI